MSPNVNSDAWGNRIENLSWGSWTNTWASRDGRGHNTKEYDGDSGLIYMYQRWYQPELGRFISRDPAKADGNYYLFAANSPSGSLDPRGLYTIDASCTSNPGNPFSPWGVTTPVKVPVAWVKSCQAAVKALGLTDKKMDKCMSKFCKNGTVTCACTGDVDCAQQTKPDLSVGVPMGGSRAGTGKITLCPYNIRIWYGDDDLRKGKKLKPILLHEMAHECDWNHGGAGGKPGVPFPGGLIK